MPEETSNLSPLSESCPDCGTVLDVSSEEPFSQVQCPVCGKSVRARTQFNNFMLQTQLGMGGMGVVYRALDVNLNRMVALKVVLKEYSSDPAYHAKFEHEARITASINHPHVVKVYSFGSDHGLFYIAMELVDKGSLDDLILREGRLSEARTLDVGIQIAQGLDAALKRGLIHRDVKPGNILFADSDTAKIVDFGLAVPMEHGAEGGKHGEEVWGTPFYIAPEKLTYEPEDFRSDIYSLGASLFHALAGKPSFDGETTSLSALREFKSKPVSLQAAAPDISSATAFVINRTLCMDPKDRHQSYDELIEHLEYAKTRLLEKEKRFAWLRGDAPFETPEQKKKKKIIQIAAAACVVFVLALGWIWKRTDAYQKQTAAVEQAKKFNITVVGGEKGYLEARSRLVRGDYARAQIVFHELGAQPNVPHPLDRWIMLHEGLSALLAGHLKDAQAIFKKLEDGGVYSEEPEDRTLAKFFVDAGHAIAPGKPLPAGIAKDFNAGSASALGLFIFAVNDWEMSHFDEAQQIFQAFIDSDPKQSYDWVADYKPLAQKYVADYAAYQKVSGAITDAGNLQKEKEAMENLVTLKNSVQVPGRLPEKLAAMETDLQKKIAADEAAEKARAAQLAAQREQETKALAAAKAKFTACLPGYQYAEALEAIDKTQITDAALGTEKAALLKKAQWLAKFKETLIADLNTTGYPLPVAKINGVPIEGEVHKATQTQIEIQTKYGPVVVLWTEVPVSQILSISNYFTGKITTPEQVANRQWLSGVFAMQTGMPKEGKLLMEVASETKSEYHDQIPLFETGTP